MSISDCPEASLGHPWRSSSDWNYVSSVQCPRTLSWSTTTASSRGRLRRASILLFASLRRPPVPALAVRIALQLTSISPRLAYAAVIVFQVTASLLAFHRTTSEQRPNHPSLRVPRSELFERGPHFLAGPSKRTMAVAKSPQRACRLMRPFLEKASDSDPSFTHAAWNNAGGRR
ncbi:hypothetical protein BHM03_00027657 [Ensete ventricosum]|nr:hypothetical protein BHM03_00027657 [Ensete ventricosum]